MAGQTGAGAPCPCANRPHRDDPTSPVPNQTGVPFSDGTARSIPGERGKRRAARGIRFVWVTRVTAGRRWSRPLPSSSSPQHHHWRHRPRFPTILPDPASVGVGKRPGDRRCAGGGVSDALSGKVIHGVLAESDVSAARHPDVQPADPPLIPAVVRVKGAAGDACTPAEISDAYPARRVAHGSLGDGGTRSDPLVETALEQRPSLHGCKGVRGGANSNPTRASEHCWDYWGRTNPNRERRHPRGDPPHHQNGVGVQYPAFSRRPGR